MYILFCQVLLYIDIVASSILYLIDFRGHLLPVQESSKGIAGYEIICQWCHWYTVRPRKKEPHKSSYFFENCNDLSEKVYIVTKFSLSSFFWHQL